MSEQSAGADQCYCPMCSFDLWYGDIPPEKLETFGYEPIREGRAAPVCVHGCGRPPHFSQLFAVMGEAEDGTPFVKEYQCPNCLERWPA